MMCRPAGVSDAFRHGSLFSLSTACLPSVSQMKTSGGFNTSSFLLCSSKNAGKKKNLPPLVESGPRGRPSCPENTKASDTDARKTFRPQPSEQGVIFCTAERNQPQKNTKKKHTFHSEGSPTTTQTLWKKRPELQNHTSKGTAGRDQEKQANASFSALLHSTLKRALATSLLDFIHKKQRTLLFSIFLSWIS